MYRTLFAAVAIASLTSLPATAQDRARAILGVVRDTALKPLPGVEVLLLSPQRSVVTDAAGLFRLEDVPAGRRHLLIRRIGYLPVRPTVEVPQNPAETLAVVLLPAVQFLPPIIVETEKPGIRGVVGDTAYHALPDALVELLGARREDTTDQKGRFAFEALKQGQYVLRVSRIGYISRLVSVELASRGQEYSIFLEQYRPGLFDWQATREAAIALPDLATRMATEPKRTRMTRAELARYGTMALCDIPRLRTIVPPAARRRPGLDQPNDPNIVWRGSSWLKNTTLCSWSADEIDLVEWGPDPCREAAKTIAEVLGVYCGPTRVSSINLPPPALSGRGPWVVLWPRN